MPGPRKAMIGRMMIATAIVAILCATLMMLQVAWEPIAYYLGWLIPEAFSPAWVLLMVLMIFVGPFLLAGSGFILFPIRVEPEAKGEKSTKSESNDP